MYLLFDVSGNGKPLSWKAPATDLFNWPKLIHASWILLGEDLKPIKDFDCLITPEGFEIKEIALKQHHIEASDIKEKGTPLEKVLDEFEACCKEAKFLFAHNMSLNENILGAEFLRLGRKNPINYMEGYCLMEEGTYLCQLPGKGGKLKWPSLQELHTRIFKKGFTPSQNARADVIAASRCFIGMKKAGLLDEIFDRDEDE